MEVESKRNIQCAHCKEFIPDLWIKKIDGVLTCINCAFANKGKKMIPKYRAYYRPDNKIYSVNRMLWNEDGSLYGVSLNYDKDKDKMPSLSTIELMQWIGSLDSKEEEIFEHQILKLTNSEGEISYHLVVRGDSSYPAFYLKPGLDDESNDFSYLYATGEYDVEVAGDKFTNPELLEGADRE